MLVLANGAYKSGSSWLLAILKELAPFDVVSEGVRRLTRPVLGATRR